MQVINRYTSSTLMLIVLAGMICIFLQNEPLYHTIISYWGGDYRTIPFSDLNAVLTQIKCYKSGLDLFHGASAALQCGTFNYSPLLLRLVVFNVDPSSSYIAGIVIAGAFACCLATLPPPQNNRELLYTAAASLSGITFWAVNTCNLDLVLFMIVVLSASLLPRGGVSRLLAYALMLMAGLLKYYPCVLMAHVLRERLKLVLLVVAVAAVALAVFLALFIGEFSSSLAVLPRCPYFIDCWGANVLPFGLFNVLTDVDPQDQARTALVDYLPPISLACMMLLAAFAAVRYSKRPDFADAFVGLPERDKALFVSGALLIVGCFFAWQNHSYRGIFFLCVMPGLLSMRRSPALADREIIRLPIWILILMWGEVLWLGIFEAGKALGYEHIQMLYEQILFWAFRQMLWWYVVSVLCGFLIVFVRQSQAWHEMSRCVGSFRTG